MQQKPASCGIRAGASSDLRQRRRREIAVREAMARARHGWRREAKSY
jgi:hypothetical protein